MSSRASRRTSEASDTSADRPCTFTGARKEGGVRPYVSTSSSAPVLFVYCGRQRGMPWGCPWRRGWRRRRPRRGPSRRARPRTRPPPARSAARPPERSVGGGRVRGRGPRWRAVVCQSGPPALPRPSRRASRRLSAYNEVGGGAQMTQQGGPQNGSPAVQGSSERLPRCVKRPRGERAGRGETTSLPIPDVAPVTRYDRAARSAVKRGSGDGYAAELASQPVWGTMFRGRGGWGSSYFRGRGG